MARISIEVEEILNELKRVNEWEAFPDQNVFEDQMKQLDEYSNLEFKECINRVYEAIQGNYEAFRKKYNKLIFEN